MTENNLKILEKFLEYLVEYTSNEYIDNHIMVHITPAMWENRLQQCQDIIEEELSHK